MGNMLLINQLYIVDYHNISNYLLKNDEFRVNGSNPLETSNAVKPLVYQGVFFALGQVFGRLGQNHKSNYLLRSN